MFVRVTNWATALALALAVTFAALLQWNEYIVSSHAPSPERELLRTLTLVPIVAIGFFAMGGVAWLVCRRFNGVDPALAERSDIGIVAFFFGAYITLITGCLVESPWPRGSLSAAGHILLYYLVAGLLAWLWYRAVGRMATRMSRYRWTMSTEQWTYAWLVYGKLATPGLLALGYLNFQLRWSPWLALLVSAAYLVALRYALLLIHRLLNWPILTEENMAP